MEAFKLILRLTFPALLVPGCAATNDKMFTPKVQPVADRPVAPETHRPTDEGFAQGQQSVAEQDADLLAAIEDFLERTKDLASEEVVADSRSAAGDRPRESLPGVEAASVRAKSDPKPAGPSESPPSAVKSTTMANNGLALQDPPTTIQQALPVIEQVSIRPPSAPTAQEAPPAKVAAANAALEMHAVDRDAAPERFLALLEKRASEESNFQTEWQLRLTQLALRPQREIEAVSEALPDESRQALMALLRLARSVREIVLNPQRSGDEALAQIDNLRRVVAQHADPVVSTVALCRRVLSFGVYEEMEEVELVAGRPVQTIVYSQIENLAAEETSDGRFRTRLSTRLEVFSDDGRSVWQHKEPEVVDVCRRPRRDFFIAHRVTLPPTLPAGEYVLKVLVEDLHSGKVDEAAKSFTLQSALTAAQSMTGG